MLRMIVGLVLLAGAADAGERFTLRRIGMLAACAASFWDASTTQSAVAAGARETNRLLARPDGGLRWGRLLAIKGGLCAGTIAAQEIRKPHGAARTAWTGVNFGLAGVYAGAALHNRSVTAGLLAKQARSR